MNKLLAIFIGIAGLHYHIFAQQTTSSPYSSIGIGEWEPNYPTYLNALGGAATAARSPSKINYANPATVGYLTQPVYDVGLSVYTNTVRTDTGKASKNNVYMRNVFLGFPIAKRWWGIAVGLKPLTKMNYQFTNQWADSLGTYTQSYEGFGGINELTALNAFNLLKDSINYLSLGIKTSYLFGSIQKTAQLFFPETANAFNTQNIVRYDFSGFQFTPGIMYSRNIHQNYTITTGATYSVIAPVRTIRLKLVNTFEGTSGLSNIKDTISYINDTLTSMIPSGFSIGTSISHKKWWIGASYTVNNMKELQLAAQQQNLTTHTQISLGIQYTPDAEAVNNLTRLSAYRVGFRKTNLIATSQTQMQELGISFGIGVPVIKSKSETTFNFAVEIGNRKYDNFATSIKNETFSQVSFGFSFTPHKFDRWFYRRKID